MTTVFYSWQGCPYETKIKYEEIFNLEKAQWAWICTHKELLVGDRENTEWQTEHTADTKETLGDTGGDKEMTGGGQILGLLDDMTSEEMLRTHT